MRWNAGISLRHERTERAERHSRAGSRPASITLATLVLALALTAGMAHRLTAEDGTRWVEVELQDGTKVTAPLVRSSRTSVTVSDNGAEREYSMDKVKNVNYLDGPPANYTPPAPPPTPAPTPPAAPDAPATPDTPATPATPPATPATPATPDLPAGDQTPPATPGTITPPIAGDTPPAPASGVGASIEVPLPTDDPKKPLIVKLKLKWTDPAAGEAPWTKLNRGSSLHQMPDWTRADPEKEKAILALIDALPAPDAKKQLTGMQADAAPYLVIFLLDADPLRAQACAQLLIARGNGDVAKYFIEALYALTDANNKALEPWLQPYAKTLVDGCKQFAGIPSSMDPAKAPFSAAEFVDGWKQNLADAQPQLGEPAFAPDPVPANADEQKLAWVTFFRTLALKRTQFTKPKEEKVDLTRKYPPAKDADHDRQIRADLALLATDKEQDALAAKARLLNGTWSEVAPYLAQALIENKNMAVRLTILDMISTKGDRSFTWHVLMTLKDAWGSPTMVPGANNAALIRISDVIVRKLTGFTEQPAVQPTFIGGYKAVQGFIDYWNAHFLEFPAQYGEPELDKTSPKYNDYLKELRYIKTGEGGK